MRLKGIHPAHPYCWLWKGIHHARLSAGGRRGDTLPVYMLYVERDTLCTSILLVRNRYTLLVNTSGSGNDTPCKSILLAVEMDTPCTSILLVVEMDTPCTSILLAVERDTPCTVRPYYDCSQKHPSQEHLCTDLSYYDYSQYNLPRNVHV